MPKRTLWTADVKDGCERRLHRQEPVNEEVLLNQSLILTVVTGSAVYTSDDATESTTRRARQNKSCTRYTGFHVSKRHHWGQLWNPINRRACTAALCTKSDGVPPCCCCRVCRSSPAFNRCSSSLQGGYSAMPLKVSSKFTMQVSSVDAAVFGVDAAAKRFLDTKPSRALNRTAVPLACRTH